jgi:CheY-like chemotaxis protein
MAMENELSDLLNLPAGGGEDAASRLPPWKILIVDDEGDVHAVTKLVLADFVFRERGLAFLDAYNGYSACKLMEEHPDTAVILLDVVMESSDAGLQVIRHIREKLKNSRVRIILRTGQPGEAPEQNVIINYDINDYKCKTELTAQKLFSALITALRSYEDIAAAENDRCGLMPALEAVPLTDAGSQTWFLSGLLMQAGAMLGIAGRDMVLLRRSAESGADRYAVVAALGKNEGRTGLDAARLLDTATLDELRRVGGSGILATEHGVFFIPAPGMAIYAEGEMTPKEEDWAAVGKYCNKVCQAIFNYGQDGGCFRAAR